MKMKTNKQQQKTYKEQVLYAEAASHRKSLFFATFCLKFGAKEICERHM